MVEIDPEAAASLRALGTVVPFGRRARLFAQHDDPGPVALIESGRFEISAATEEGVELLLAIRRPGELIGEFAAVDGRPRSVTATALDDAEVTLIDRDRFLDWLRDRPDVMFGMLVSLVSTIRDVDASRVELAASAIDHRVVMRLVVFAGEHGETVGEDLVAIRPAPTPESLASFTGAGADAVARSLERLVTLGALERRREELMVDLAALRRMGVG